jgi:hypothetical protein
MSMMGLMDDPVEAEAHQTEGANHHPVEFIEASIFSEQPVSGFVQANQAAMHQVAGHQNERHRQPEPSSLHGERECHFGSDQTENEKLECLAQNPMWFMQLAEIFEFDRRLHGNSIQQFGNASFRRATNASEDPLKYAIEVFDVTLGKQILAKKPGDFRSGAILGNFAPELKTRGAGRTHGQSGGKIGRSDLRHRVILQSKAHLE